MEPVHGSANVTLPMIQVVPPGPPHTYPGIAHSLARGVEPLFAAQNCEVPLTFLCGQVAECSLKAILSRNGDDKRLKSPSLQHKLVALWELAMVEGTPMEAVAPAWLQALSELHAPPYYIRYSTKVKGLDLPVQSLMVIGVRALLELAAKQCRGQ